MEKFSRVKGTIKKLFRVKGTMEKLSQWNKREGRRGGVAGRHVGEREGRRACAGEGGKAEASGVHGRHLHHQQLGHVRRGPVCRCHQSSPGTSFVPAASVAGVTPIEPPPHFPPLSHTGETDRQGVIGGGGREGGKEEGLTSASAGAFAHAWEHVEESEKAAGPCCLPSSEKGRAELWASMRLRKLRNPICVTF